MIKPLYRFKDCGINIKSVTHLAPLKYRDKTLNKEFKKSKENKILFKPSGVWLSVDGRWERWCKENNYLNHDGKIAQYDVKLDEYTSLCVIDSLDDYNNIMRDIFSSSKYDKLKSKRMTLFNPFNKTDLGMVKKYLKSKCHVIFLTQNGLNECHLTTNFYGWDCPSILLFDTKKITNVKYIKQFKIKRRKNGTWK